MEQYIINLSQEERRLVIEQAEGEFYDRYKWSTKQNEPLDHFSPSLSINNNCRLSCWVEEQEEENPAFVILFERLHDDGEYYGSTEHWSDGMSRKALQEAITSAIEQHTAA